MRSRILGLFGGLIGTTAFANGSVPVIEALPHHLQVRVSEQQSALLPEATAPIARGVVNQLKAWPPEVQNPKACFFGGSDQLRARIVKVASSWSSPQASLKIDFGGPTGRLCSSQQQYHIRIGFRYPGYWSTVGQDSYVLAGQNEQSLNLQYFDVAPPSGAEFSRVVLHEIGHALGFEHEHQNPLATCEKEFNWPVLYKELAGPPNYWPAEQVDRNMRALLHGNVRATGFNRDSIMLYTFAERYYLKGKASSCFSAPNDGLSPGDLELLAAVYPSKTDDQTERRNALARQYVDILTQANVELKSQLDAYVELRKLNQGALPEKAIAVFSPSDLKLPPNVQLPESLRDVRPIG